ncbi:MAG: hypothetical protein WHT09_07560 [Thermogutta sp.]
MVCLARLFIAAWILIGWAPHGVCGVEAYLLPQAAPPVTTMPTSQGSGCPYCGRNQVLGGAPDGGRNIADSFSRQSSSDCPTEPHNPHPCCHPHPGILSPDSSLQTVADWQANTVASFAWDETQCVAGMFHEQLTLAENHLTPTWQNVPLYVACCSFLI